MNYSVPHSVDVIVCGAGPAGLVAAWRLAESGVKVFLVDRRDPWREPVACAEAVHAKALHTWIGDVDANWIRGPVNGVEFVAPNGIKIEYRQENSGWILDRTLMHRGLAERAYAAGAQLHFRANAQSLSREDDSWVVGMIIDQNIVSIQAKCVLDCTGPGGKLTKGIAGLESLENGATDLEPAVFALIDGIDHRADLIELGFSSRLFPGGYGWVFPRDGKTANVGLVIGKEHLANHSPRKLLQQWIAERWPGLEGYAFQGGAIACGQSRKALACDGVFKAGDAASQVNPISRSGIVEGMKGGTLAARSIIQWMQEPTEQGKRKIEAKLLDDWFEVQGNAHERLARAKKAFGKVPDSVFDGAATRIARMPVAKRTLPRIFLSTLLRSPRLLWSMRSLMGF